MHVHLWQVEEISFAKDDHDAKVKKRGMSFTVISPMVILQTSAAAKIILHATSHDILTLEGIYVHGGVQHNFFALGLVCKITIALIAMKDIHLFWIVLPGLHSPCSNDHLPTCPMLQLGSNGFSITSIIGGDGAAGAKVSQGATIQWPQIKLIRGCGGGLFMILLNSSAWPYLDHA